VPPFLNRPFQNRKFGEVFRGRYTSGVPFTRHWETTPYPILPITASEEATRSS